VVHAKGGGAYGVFEATEDVSQYRDHLVSNIAGHAGLPR
jgi:catalase